MAGSRTSRVIRTTLRALALVLVFVAACVTALVLHLDTRPARQTARRVTEAILADVLAGDVRIAGLEALHLEGTTIRHVRIRDPDGRVVIDALDVRGEIDTATLLASLLGDGPLRVPVVESHVERAVVSLGSDEGELWIASTFAVAEPAPPDTAPAPIVTLPRITVGHGTVTDVPGIGRGEARGLRAALRTSEAVHLGLSEARVSAALPAVGWADARATGELHVVDAGLTARAALSGAVASVPLSVRARIAGDALGARLQVGPATGPQLSSLAPPLSKMEGAGRLDAQVDGTIEAPRVTLRAVHTRADGREAQLDALVDGDLSGPPRAQARLDFAQIDLSAFGLGLPSTTLTGRARTEATASEPPNASLQLELEPATIGGRPTPHARLDATVRDDVVDAMVVLDGPGRVRAHARLDGQQLRARARLDDVALAALPVDADLGGRLDGGLRAQVTLAPDLAVEDSHVDLRARDLSLPGVRAGRVRVTGSAEGRPEAIDSDATLDATGLTLGGRRFARAHATVRGQAGTLDVDAQLLGGPLIDRLHARSHVDVATRRLLDSRVSVRSGSLAVEVSVPRIALDDGVEIPEATVTGLGEPARAWVSRHGRGLEAYVYAPRVELSRIGALLENSELDGRLSVHAHLKRDGRRHEGKILTTVEDFRIDAIDEVDLHLDAELDDRQLAGIAKLTWGELGRVRLQLDPVRLGASDPTTLEAWRRATGRVSLLTHLALDELSTFAQTHLPRRAALPFGGLRGVATLGLSAEREQPGAPPTLRLGMSTEGLAVVGPSQFLTRDATGDRRAPPRWQLHDIDLSTEIILDGQTEEVEVEVRATDPHGGLVWVDADAVVPYAALWREDLARLRSEDPTRWLRRVKLDAWAQTDRRPLEDYPAMLGLDRFEGEGRLQAWFSGSFDEPSAGIDVEVTGFGDPLLGLTERIDANAEASWKASEATADVQLGTAEQRLLDAHGTLHAELADALGGDLSGWRAEADVESCALPLGLFQTMRDHRVSGLVTGRVELDDLGTPDVRLSVDAQADELKLGPVLYDLASVTARAENGHAAASIEGEHGDGRLSLSASSPVPWTGPVPELDAADEAKLSLEADSLRLGSFQPFVEDAVPALDGRLDADMQVTLDDTPSASGSMSIREGRFQLAGFGERFFGARADVKLHPDGRLVLESFEARSLDGKIEGDGRARFDGLDFAHAQASLRLVEPLPVVMQGRSWGEAEGRFELEAQPDNGGLVIDVGVPELRVELPRAMPGNVQTLGPSKTIRIGRVKNGEMMPIPLSPPEPAAEGSGTPLLVRVDLGEVEIRRQQQLRAYLGGGPTIEVTDEVRMAGRIVIEGGTLKIQGREFELEESFVTFAGRPPDNPEIVATAVWESPQGTKVYADYVGPLKTGKVELRSDPPMSDNQIVSLLVFGDSSGQGASADGRGSAGQAAGVGGAVVAEGLNEAISDLTDLDLAAGVGSTAGGGTTTELELRIARNLSLEFAHVLGIDQPGYAGDRNLATIEWRFVHDWSLEATVGDQGSTSLDVLWQHRY